MFLKEGLRLDGANLKVLKQTMKMGVIASTSSPSYFPLSQLEWLCLEEVNNLFYLLQYNMDSGQKELKEKRCFKSCGYSIQSKGIILLKFPHLEFCIQQVLVQLSKVLLNILLGAWLYHKMLTYCSAGKKSCTWLD